MKKLYYSLLGLLTVLLITSLTVSQNQSKGMFEKVIWLEIDLKEDSVLFKPYSKAWNRSWEFNYGEGLSIDIGEAPILIMDYGKYTSNFDKRNDNLWTVLHPKIIDGTIRSYSPIDPANFMTFDEGEMRFPITDKKNTFLSSKKVREELSYVLGNLGPESDIPRANMYGEDSVRIKPDSTIELVYPPRDFMWYEDKDIIKYKLRISVLYNKNGVEKKRFIKSIAPVVNQYDDYGSRFVGSKELLWLDFKELEPILKKVYFFDENNKPVSYLKYFQQKLNATLKVNN